MNLSEHLCNIRLHPISSGAGEVSGLNNPGDAEFKTSPRSSAYLWFLLSISI